MTSWPCCCACPRSSTLPFRAGQYLDVMLPAGRRRSFLARECAERRRAARAARAPRAPASGFTAQLFDTMQPGALLRIEGPLGQFWLRLESPRPVADDRRRHRLRAAARDAAAAARQR